MSGLTAKVKAILSGRGGESLMESIASLFVFSVLMLAVTAMIRASLTMTASYNSYASLHQNKINEGIMESYSGVSAKLYLQGSGVDVEIPIELFDEDGCEAFAPEVQPA